MGNYTEVALMNELSSVLIAPPWESWLVTLPPPRVRRVYTVRRGYSPYRGVHLTGWVPSLDVPMVLKELGQPVRVVRRIKDGGVTGDVGIDLAVRGHEVRKLFYAGGFTGTLMREGIDPEDFLQEVYRGLLARDRGTCPWDAKKSSFGHYVHIVIKCVLSNYLRKDRRRTSHEDLTSDGSVVEAVGGISEGGDDFGRREVLRELFPTDWALAERIVSRVEMGAGRKEVAHELGVPVVQVDGVLKTIRECLT